MKVITVSDVLNWTPDVSARGGWGEMSESHLMGDKTYIGKSSDLRDYSTLVHVVHIRNFYGETVWSGRIAGSDEDVRIAADEVLNIFCRRWAGTFLSYSISRYVEKD